MQEKEEQKRSAELNNILNSDQSAQSDIDASERFTPRNTARGKGDLIDKLFRAVVAAGAAVFSSGVLFGALEVAEVITLDFEHPLQLASLAILTWLWYKALTWMGFFTD